MSPRVRDHRILAGDPILVADALGVAPPQPVTLYEDPQFGGRSMALEVGEHRLPDDFNDAAASIQVPAGYVALLFEQAEEGGGYGISVDLLEDCPDLSAYGLSKQVSFVSVFAATNAGFIWIRGKGLGDSYVPGHWERPRASGVVQNDAVGAVSPPLPSRAPAAGTTPTTIQVSGSAFHITNLGPQDPGYAQLWQHAVSDQLGVLGSDYRGAEVIGSAAFERASNVDYIPNNINFWYPQRQPRDHRSNPYFKRTCIGTFDHVSVEHIEEEYRDNDLDIYIRPDELYKYLISDGHPREYTDIMKAQWEGSGHDSGYPSCDTPETIKDFEFVEAEIQPFGDLASGAADALKDRIDAADDRKVGVYGPWIWDRAHCCHAEIHPAEEIWWRSGTTYHLNVICDASKRFWWRSQMDDGTKLKPWAAPPITGVFGIAFEVAPPGPAVKGPLVFSVSDIIQQNAAKKSNGEESSLFYNGTTLVRFVPNDDSLAASFEQVGVAENGNIRGFLVLEATVGKLNQTLVTSEFPAGTDVNAIDEDDEGKVFDKEEGHYMFSVSEWRDDSPVVSG